MNAIDIIARKRDGFELSSDEIHGFITGVADGSVPDYQSAAWLMAVFLRGMSGRETLDLALAMRDSGERIDLSDLPTSVDKHSTGGVGDKTSLIVVPIMAAAGVPVLKMSGRGLGYSGGTVDKLESIPGFRTDLTVEVAKEVVRVAGSAMVAQSAQLAPADRALYALRDVTATIECIPLIASSIMSKKLAAGGQRIVLDVKCGRGAFMKTPEHARQLAEAMVEIGNGAGVPTVALVSRMDEPLGHAVGNALEIGEAIDILQCRSDQPDEPFLELCNRLAALGIVAAGKSQTIDSGLALSQQMLESGAASVKLEAMIAAQGGPTKLDRVRCALPQAEHVFDVLAATSGVVAAVDAESIGRLVCELGAGRQKKGDSIDPAAGIYIYVKTGAAVTCGDRLATLHLRAQDKGRTAELAARVRSAYNIVSGVRTARNESMIIDTIGE